MSTIKRGDRVTYRGKIFYAAPNGSSVFLFAKADLSGSPLHTPQKKSVRKVRPRKSPSKKKKKAPPLPKPPAVLELSSTSDEESAEDGSTKFVTPNDSLSSESDEDSITTQIMGHRYFYVAVDLDKRSDQVKIGISNNLSKRLRSYRTVSPDYQFVLVVDTASERTGRDIEGAFKLTFAEERIGISEIFRLRARVAEDFLRRRSWVRGEAGVFLAQKK